MRVGILTLSQELLCVDCSVCCRYGVAFLYGAKLVRDASYSPGKVILVMISMLIGGFALGQASPDFSYFVAGRAAGARLMTVINRQPQITITGGTVPNKPMQVPLRFTIPRLDQRCLVEGCHAT